MYSFALLRRAIGCFVPCGVFSLLLSSIIAPTASAQGLMALEYPDYPDAQQITPKYGRVVYTIQLSGGYTERQGTETTNHKFSFSAKQTLVSKGGKSTYSASASGKYVTKISNPPNK